MTSYPVSVEFSATFVDDITRITPTAVIDKSNGRPTRYIYGINWECATRRFSGRDFEIFSLGEGSVVGGEVGIRSQWPREGGCIPFDYFRPREWLNRISHGLWTWDTGAIEDLKIFVKGNAGDSFYGALHGEWVESK